MMFPHKAWQYAVNDVFSRSSYPHHAYLAMSSLASPRFEYIFHVTRCPLRHISAFTSHLTSTYQFIRHQMLVHNFTGISARSELYLVLRKLVQVLCRVYFNDSHMLET